MSTTRSTKPVPIPDEGSAPFFEGAKRGELMIRRCRACRHAMWPASHSGALPLSPRCHTCFAPDLEWVAASGAATLYSFTVVHQPYPGFEDDVPDHVALVEHAEGPRLLSSLVDCDNADLRVGMPLEVVFEQWTDDVTLPKFRSTA